MPTTYQLFGGAITVELEGDYMDASLYRQVPDSQEVLLHRDSDVSVIVEVLQCVSQATDPDGMNEGVRYHYDSLAHDNSALSTHVDSVDAPNGAASEGTTPQPALLFGTQRVRKFGKTSEENDVAIHLALWRLPSKNVDLVLSINDPTRQMTHAQSRHAAQSLRIVDWGLFP
ncbi:guanyl-nucleotide exchange factor [Malassezia pachydermatis]|uniref:Mog1p/PsbP-like protein n=1 Tax=Malassezia pachydermatis TaxID=77020 RepID=A0A0M8MS39_9BASI|nr:hypothetical protein Malapachy_2801 [Malassezia pachydermatis]KOS12521.1 hypothetical protein Malapachy_2801 [Malassezia pachydermatis]